MRAWLQRLKLRFFPNGMQDMRGSLSPMVFVLFLAASLLPILVVGITGFSGARFLLRKQTLQQINNAAVYQTSQLEQFTNVRTQIIDPLATATTLHTPLLQLIHAPVDSSEAQQAKETLQSILAYTSRGFFDQIFLVDQQGRLLAAGDNAWMAQNFCCATLQDPTVLSLLGTNTAKTALSNAPIYANKPILFLSRSFVDENNQPAGTLIAVTPIPAEFLAQSKLPSGYRQYYFTADGVWFGVFNQNTLTSVAADPSILPYLRSIAGDKQAQIQFQATTSDRSTANVSAQWIAQAGLGVIVSAAEQSIFQQYGVTVWAVTAFVLAALLLYGILVFVVIQYFIQPLHTIQRTASRFVTGNWSERIPVTRNDEIGRLATSYNRLADEVTGLNRSIEATVENRMTQIRTASAIAQQATATTRLEDALGRTVELIVEHFGFYHVAIYLFDETRQNLVLREASGEFGRQIKAKGEQIDVDMITLVPWVANHNHVMIITDVLHDPLFQANALLPDTLSEIAIPVTLAGEVLGVLDIQSTLIGAFGDETATVFQTLANQISSTLQNTRLLESVQTKYRETALLYRVSRQVSQARGKAEIVQILTDAFIQLPFVCAILSVEEENFRIQVMTDSKTGRIEKGLQSLNIPHGNMRNLLEENRLVVIEDIRHASDYDNLVSFLLRRGYFTATLLPILENGRLSTVFVFGTNEPNLMNENAMQPYANLAEVVSAAFEKQNILTVLQRRLTELQTLTSFSEAISAETELDSLYRVLHQQIMQTFGADLSFALALYHAEDATIEFPYSFEDQKLSTHPAVPLGKGLTSLVLQERQPLLLETEQQVRTRNPIIAGKVPRSWVGIPLIFANDMVGAMIVQDTVNEHRFVKDDINLLMTLAPQVATAVRNAQLLTDRQQAIQAYDQERFLLSVLLDNMPEAVSFKDVHGHYIRASRSVAELLQTNEQTMVGKTDYDLMDHAVAEKNFREEQLLININKAEFGRVEQSFSEDGSPRWTQISRIPIRTAADEPYGLLLIHNDISALKQTENLAQHRADQVLTAAEIARDVSGTLNVEALLQKSVQLVRERFGFYHSSVFLLDEMREYAILRQSTGDAGRKMLQDGHRLAVGSKSIVGQVTALGQPLVINDVTQDPTHLPNPLLPDTRSEMAIPLQVGDRILGALDVQSTQVDAFHAEDIQVLTILADQLAIAILNTELFTTTQELLDKHHLLSKISIAASLGATVEDVVKTVVDSLHSAGVAERIAFLLNNTEGILQIHASAGYADNRHLDLRIIPGQGVTGQAALEKRPIRVDETSRDAHYIALDEGVRSELAIPILFGDRFMGVLNLESTRRNAFDENDVEIMSALGNNLGGVLATQFLVNQARQQVAREQRLYEITNKIRHSVDLDTILETSVKEIGQTLGAQRAKIRITIGQPEMDQVVKPVIENAPTQFVRNGETAHSNQSAAHKNGKSHSQEQGQ